MKKSFSFFTLSTLFHVALAVGIAHFTYKASQKLPKVTEVEFMAQADASDDAGVADVQATPVQTASAPVEQAEPSITPTPVTEEAETAPAQPVAALPAKTKSKPAPSPKAVVKAQEPVVETQLEDAPAIDVTDEQPEAEEAPAVAAVPVETTPANEESTPEIDTQTQQAEIEQLTDQYKADADEQFKQAEKDLAESQIEEARVLEEQAAKDKAAAEAALQAEAANAAGGDTAQTAQAGSGTEAVRPVAELKQMPGNKKPTYDVVDRKAGRAGEVVFTAYVSKTGSLSDFKLVKSSGHRSLDAKTLSALKTWKFYPNQEGRTELGFKWDLKGEAVEMPSTLRR